MINPIQVEGLFIGSSQVLHNKQRSAIHKIPVCEIILKKDYIVNDEVVDQKHHGGPMRVIHHYSEVNYNHLKSTFPEIADRFKPGTFGENLYTKELTENDLCVGDIFTIGSCEIQLTVPRRPCSTLNAGYQDDRILKEVMASAHVGWYYRVIKEGKIMIQDRMILQDRPYNDLKITKLFEQGYGIEKFKDTEFLKACLKTGLMDKGWKPKLENI